jgi:hypothetical protein
MITPHPRLKVNVAKKLLRFDCRRRATHHLRISSEPMNHGRQSAASAFFHNLLVLLNQKKGERWRSASI